MSATAQAQAQAPQGRTTQPTQTLAELRRFGKSSARDVAANAGGATVQAFFEKQKDAIAAMLPKHMTPDRMLKIALRCLRTTPKLLDCTLDSLFGATITCAQLGLEPNTPQGHVYLIPFKGRKQATNPSTGIKAWVDAYDVQVVLGYKGLIDLARRSGQIVSISARVVHERDHFELEYGTEEKVVHRPFMEGDAGEPIGVYSVAKLKDGGTQFEFMTVSQINVIRDNSQGYASAIRNATDKKPAQHPWIQHWEEMARKTAIRRLSKYLPMSIELASAVELDGAAEGGRGQGMGAVLDGVDYTVMPEEAPVTGDGEDEATDASGGADGQAALAAPGPDMSLPEPKEAVVVEEQKTAAPRAAARRQAQPEQQDQIPLD